MEILIKLFTEFFQLGIFSYGGGLVILALMQDKVEVLGWLTAQQFADVVSIAQSTPGPVAINLATFVGYMQKGVLGSVIATLGVAIPGFAVSMIVGKFMSHFDEKPMVKGMLKGLRAFVIGMIAVAIVNIAKVTLVDWDTYNSSHKFKDFFDMKSVVIFLMITFLAVKYKKHPFVYILPAAALGMVMWH